MAVSKRLRFEILRRDKHTCRYCGRRAPEVALHVDHVVATTLGGKDEPGNLVAACADCNSGKSSVPVDAEMVANVDSDAVRWRRAVIVASQENELSRAQAKKLKAQFDEEWSRWTSGFQKKPVARDPSWWNTVEMMLTRGLTMDDLIELIEVAMNSRANDTWKYFCGCCWKRIEQLEKRAAEIVHQEGSPQGATAEATIQTTWDAEAINYQLEYYASELGHTRAEFKCDMHPDRVGCPDVVCGLVDLSYRVGNARARARVTGWSWEDVDATLTSAMDLAAQHLTVEEMGFVSCRHRESGYCPSDWVCAVEYATNLIWLALNQSNGVAPSLLRDEAIMDAADLAEAL